MLVSCLFGTAHTAMFGSSIMFTERRAIKLRSAPRRSWYPSSRQLVTERARRHEPIPKMSMAVNIARPVSHAARYGGTRATPGLGTRSNGLAGTLEIARDSLASGARPMSRPLSPPCQASEVPRPACPKCTCPRAPTSGPGSAKNRENPPRVMEPACLYESVREEYERGRFSNSNSPPSSPFHQHRSEREVLVLGVRALEYARADVGCSFGSIEHRTL